MKDSQIGQSQQRLMGAGNSGYGFCFVLKERGPPTICGCKKFDRRINDRNWGWGNPIKARYSLESENYSQRQKAEGRRQEESQRQKAEGKRPLSGCCSRSICPHSPAYSYRNDRLAIV